MNRRVRMLEEELIDGMFRFPSSYVPEALVRKRLTSLNNSTEK